MNPIALVDGKGFLFSGWKGPDPHDSRDWRAADHPRRLAFPHSLPPAVDNLHLFSPELYDQQTLGSCVAWAFRRAMEFVSRRAGHDWQPFSALGAYKVAQEVAGWPITEDTGLYLRDMVRAVRGRGFGREEDWPYDLTRAFQRPGAGYYRRALWYRNRAFYRVESVLEMKAVLAAGHPVVIGAAVAANFFQAAGSGRIPMPKGPWVGGHAWAVGAYEEDPAAAGGTWFIGPNSWGAWTPGGLVYAPSAMLDAAAVFPDAWTCAWVDADQPPDIAG